MRPYFGAKTHFWQTFCTNHQILSNIQPFLRFSFSEMASNTPEAEEVSRVNKLLQIEDLAWSRQLEKAVSVWIFLDLDASFYCGVQLVLPLGNSHPSYRVFEILH